MATGRHRTRHPARCAANALVIALLLWGAACTSDEVPADPPDPAPAPLPEPEPDGEPVPGGTLRIGVAADPVSIDPRFVADDEGELVIDALFDPLVRLDERLEVVGAAAQQWTVADDHRTFTFELHDASFHDGTPVTADDFRRTFDRIADGTADEPSYLSYLLENVRGFDAAQRTGATLSGVEAVDDRRLVIRLVEPDPGFLEVLTDPSLVPVPPSADEDIAAFGAQPIGNGPFAMAGPREPNAFVRLTRFDGHRSPPLLDEVLVTVYPDDQARDRQWRDFEEGALQVAELSPERRDDAVVRYGRAADGYRGPGVLDGLASTVYLYGFDTTQPPFDDPRVRRAISMSIDREALATEVMAGTRLPATSLVPPPVPGSRPGACGACRHDPQAARALLDEVHADARDAAAGNAGDGEIADDDQDGDTPGDGEAAVDEDDEADPGDQDATGQDDAPADPEADEVVVLERMTLTYNRGVTHAAIAERVAADIQAALGIDVNFQARDLQQLVQDVRSGEVSVFRMGWDTNDPSPGAYLRPLFHSSQLDADNLFGYESVQADELLDHARATSDRDQRLIAYGVAERHILADLPAMPILWYRHMRVVSPEVQDLVLSPLGRMNLTEVWLDSAAA